MYNRWCVIVWCVMFIESSSSITHMPAMEDDPRKRRPDISLAKRVLGWQPQVRMKAGLLKTIEYFRQELLLSEDQWFTGQS